MRSEPPRELRAPLTRTERFFAVLLGLPTTKGAHGRGKVPLAPPPPKVSRPDPGLPEKKGMPPPPPRPPLRLRPTFKASAPGYWVVALDAMGGVVTSCGPGFLESHLKGRAALSEDEILARAISWFISETEEAKTAPPEWAAASIAEVRLVWVKP